MSSLSILQYLLVFFITIIPALFSDKMKTTRPSLTTLVFHFFTKDKNNAVESKSRKSIYWYSFVSCAIGLIVVSAIKDTQTSNNELIQKQESLVRDSLYYQHISNQLDEFGLKLEGNKVLVERKPSAADVIIVPSDSPVQFVELEDSYEITFFLRNDGEYGQKNVEVNIYSIQTDYLDRGAVRLISTIYDFPKDKEKGFANIINKQIMLKLDKFRFLYSIKYSHGEKIYSKVYTIGYMKRIDRWTVVFDDYSHMIEK